MKNILVVEDDKDIQDVLRIIFSSFGYKVDCLANGASLLEMKSDWPDAIVLDKQLPGLNGVEVCRALKSRDESQHIPVIMISAASGVEHAAKIAGADDFIEKPFNMHVILKKIASLLDRSSHRS